MTSIAEARNCLLKLEDRNVLNNLNYIVTESIEFTEDEPHNISALNKSELDIELEICEEILALDDGTSTDSNEQLFENIDLENIFDSPESVLEIHQGASINGSYQHENIKLECENIKLECGSEDIKLECSDAHESNVQSNVETCNDPAKQLFDNESSKVSEDEFDSEIKKCCDILKDEEPSNTYATDHLSQMPILAQFNNTTDSSHIFTEEEIKTEKIEASVAAEIIVKSENVTTDASVHLDQVLLPAQFTNTTNSLQILIEKEIKSENKEIPVPVEARSPVKLEDIPLPVSEESTEKMRKKRNCEESSDSISIVHESNGTKPKKLKSVIYVPNLNMEVKCEKDEDELSLFAETDISTVEEEYEVVEGSDSPQYSKEHSDSEKDDARSKKVSPRSVVVLPETDYLHAEREDINDSGWESMKNLSSEEERYELVRKTWKSSKLPDPNRNLTYHSYRKRHLKNSSAPPKARKRKATSSLDGANTNPPKRQRSCTYLYDINIDFLSAERQKQKAVLNNQMQSEVNQLNNIYFQKEQRLQRDYYHRRNNNNAYEQIYDLRHKCQREMANIKQQYSTISNRCTFDLDSGIDKLNQARNEVLQFFRFYKGFNCEDPTVLSPSQLRELEDIENVYLQFDTLYKR